MGVCLTRKMRGWKLGKLVAQARDLFMLGFLYFVHFLPCRFLRFKGLCLISDVHSFLLRSFALV